MLRVLSKSKCFPVFFFFFVHVYARVVVDDRSSITISSSNSLGLSRLDFPPDFVFGAGTSAYQVEGAAAEGGRKPSIWDTYTHAGKTPDKGTGDIAADQYHQYKDDVKLMHKMGLDAYRFSISWSRIIPDGHGAVNPEGVKYYNNLINELVSYGIEPHVTLSHFDTPQALEDEYGGFLSAKFIGDFTAYADICFKEYGDRVKSWMTFNEPNAQTLLGYGFGGMPPGRCSYPYGINCSEGDSTTEPYVAGHNILLSHASAVHLYRKKYQEKQKGQIGITILAFWFEPTTNSPQDVAASEKILEFHIGWFMNPLVHGNYPAIMRKTLGSRLPNFTQNDLSQLKGAFDFIGLNHYCAFYINDLPTPRSSDEYGGDYIRDVSVTGSFANGMLAREFTRHIMADGTAAEKWPVTPWSMQRLLEYMKMKYKNPASVIHENGYSFTDDESSNPPTRNDTERIEYLQSYIAALLPSIRNGSNIRGYFVWSFLDCFEVTGGYTNHFGLYEVDFKNKKRTRYPKQSVQWYTNFLAKTGKMIQSSGSFVE